MNDENDLKTNNQPAVNDILTPTPSPTGNPSLDTTADQPPEQAQDNRSVGGKPPKKSHKKLLMILLILLLIGGAAAAYFLYFKKDENKQTSTVEIKEVELVRQGTSDGPTNNLFPKEGIGISYNQNRQVYEGLVGNDDKEYIPLLAESWTNPDQKTWIFKLKPDVKFHTGKVMTATDVKRSVEAVQQIDYMSFLTSTIASVEVVSDTEVKITTTEPDSLLLNRLALTYITDKDAVDAEGNDGTGPYKLDKTATYDENNATLIANDEYHQGRPKTRKVVYTVFNSDEEMNAAMKEGKIDLMATIPDEKAIAGLSDAGFTRFDSESPGTFGIYLNMLSEGPLKNKEVRKALSLALDRESLVKELDDDNLPAYQVVPKSLPGYDADISFPKLDPAAAKETLTNAGYPNGLALDYVYVSDIQPDPPIIIEQLNAAGFTITAKNYDEVDPALDEVDSGNFDLFSASYVSDLADSRDLLGALLESTEQAYPVLNDPAFDKLLEDSDKEFDPTKRIEILQEANKYIADNYLWIPMRSTAYVTFHDPDLVISEDFTGTSSIGAYYWKVGEKVSN